ncbi:MAG: hypothetical protein LBV32_01635 [Tannerellaceae bacterium]|jgi:hypothetical protein|nr:hypothetical protein [Tannerellaceae bacterium]
MDIITLLSIVTTIGGFEGIKYFINLKANKRKSVASAKTEEITARTQEFELYKKQIEYLQNRLEARDGKVDFLYAELRKKENQVLRLTADNNALKLKVQDTDNN